MTDQLGKTPATFQEIYGRLTHNVERLESALDQLLQALRKRGIQANVDLGAMIRDVRRDAEAMGRAGRTDSARLTQLQELVRVSALITSTLELDQVLEEVMDTVIHLTGAERGYLMLRDRSTGELTMQTARNWDREDLKGTEAVFSSGVVRTAIEKKETFLTTNAMDDPRVQQNLSVLSNDLRSIVCVPLLVRDEVIGVLYADNRIGQGVFNPDNVNILAAFANQAAIAIKNASTFGQVRTDLHRAERELQELRIIIDDQKKQKAVQEITQTQYFQELELKAKSLRRRTRTEEDETTSS